jgi:hypothetical protein
MERTFAKIPITKLDAARRQIETAIILWFSESDPVSIHTLVSAGHRLVYDINKKFLGLPMLGDTTNIRPGHEKEYRDILAKAANFFKHADRDAEETLSFSPESNAFRLLDACNVYQRLAAETRPLMRLLVLHMEIHYPNLFLSKLGDNREVANSKLLSRRRFFDEMLPIAFTLVDGDKACRNRQ